MKKTMLPTIKITPLNIANKFDAAQQLASIKVSRPGIKILAPKTIFVAFKISGIKTWEANIIKQQLLSLGSDAGLERQALVENKYTEILIFGTVSQLTKLTQKLSGQPFNLNVIAQQLSEALRNIFLEKYCLKFKTRSLVIDRPLICGIINLTPDSFSGDGLLTKIRNSNIEIRNKKDKIKYLALKQAAMMIKAGAKILDIGAESSRPGAIAVSEKEELARLLMVVKGLRREFKKAIISVDTYKHIVALACADSGCDIINDITALRGSKNMAALIKSYKLGCVLMHMQGTPKTMQRKPHYRDLLGTVADFFKQRLDFALSCGIKREQLMLDPGIGFGKSLEDNCRLINALGIFKIFGAPLFIGLSRKSFIGKILNVGIKERLLGSLAANVMAAAKGANILRVHDVAETAQALKIVQQLNIKENYAA